MTNSLTIRILLPLALLSAVGSLPAVTLTVNNTYDALAGSLRQAIQDAAEGDTIVFDIPTNDPGHNATTGVYTINLTSAGLTINKSLVITGVGSKVVIRRNAKISFSIFTVPPGRSATIDTLTISDGSAPNYGGGINNNGDLFLNNCTLSGNQAGIYGGALNNSDFTSATIENCTFTGNTSAYGGAIFNWGDMKLTSSTLFGNTATQNGGGIFHNIAFGTAQVGDTIVAGNTAGSDASDVGGDFISDGYNFIGMGAGSTGFGNPGSHDQVGTLTNPADPKLGPLADYGGFTPTMLPFIGSPVIDQGKKEADAAAILDFDQRGLRRPADQPDVIDAVGGDGSDIGAVEVSEIQPGPDFTVTTIDDHDYGVCSTDAGCTLREALDAANSSADASTITFAPALVGMTITNTSTPTGFAVMTTVTINGPGARLLTISGGDKNRCLDVTGGTGVINGLTFAHGLSNFGIPGGGIRNSNGANLTLNDCTFSENSVTDIGGGFEYGGGVGQLNAGVLNVNRCTFANNTAGFGGGLGNFDGTVTVTNSTFTGNSAPRGGAIASTSFVVPTASLDLVSSTVVGNEATGGGSGGGVAQVGGTVTVTNSIIGGNTADGAAPNVSGTFSSQGSNVIGDPAGSTGFTGGTNDDQVGVADAKVGPLANHGGPTDTMALLTGSVAINRADATTAPERDERGYVRPDAPDVGAFEFGGTIPVTLANISTRLSVGTGDNVLIGGFIITGTEAKKVIVRAIGPSLALAGKLANPTLDLYDAAGLLVSNDDWKTAQQAEIEATGLQPSDDLESAIVATLPANAAYTAIVRGVNDTTGIGLIEVYDLDRTVDAKLANISTRGLVQTGDNVIIGGLIVLGADPQDVIIRAIGPSLPLLGKLADPTLELHDSNGAMLASNDNWRSDQETEIIASNLAPTDDMESAILRTLAPAAYTAIVRGVAETTGIALVEAYALAP